MAHSTLFAQHKSARTHTHAQRVILRWDVYGAIIILVKALSMVVGCSTNIYENLAKMFRFVWRSSFTSALYRSFLLIIIKYIISPWFEHNKSNLYQLSFSYHFHSLAWVSFISFYVFYENNEN